MVNGWNDSSGISFIKPDKVGKLIIYASTCGTRQSISPSPAAVKLFSNQSGNMMQMLQRFLPLLFPADWRNSNPSFIHDLPKSSEMSSAETLKLQMMQYLIGGVLAIA